MLVGVHWQGYSMNKGVAKLIAYEIPISVSLVESHKDDNDIICLQDFLIE